MIVLRLSKSEILPLTIAWDSVICEALKPCVSFTTLS